ncbi:MAG: hypothetical protein HQ481_11330 [Alphaproteobacteria bacterium]|nr:hypothetical protein [Alphaproteobacteria bacterium]
MSEQDQPTNTPEGVTIVIDPDCRDVFVDGVIGATVRDGIVRLNLVNIRPSLDGSDQEHAVVSRLILSRSAVRNLHNALGQVMGRLTRDGDRARPPEAGPSAGNA